MFRRGRPSTWPAAALLVLLLLGGLAFADDEDTARNDGAGWQDDGRTFVGADGHVRSIVQPEFRSAVALKQDLDTLALEGLEVRLVTPYVALPPPTPDAAVPPPEPGRLLLVGPLRVVEQALLRVDALDVPPRMVSVSMLISEVVCRSARSRGAEWTFDKGAAADASDTIFRGFDTRFDPDSYLNSELTGARPFEGTTLGFGSDDGLGGAWAATFRMLMKQGRAELFMWPNLMCSEAQSARIESVETLLIIEPSLTGPTNLTRSRAEPVGLRLEVTAQRVGESGATLDIDLWLRVAESLQQPNTRAGSAGFRERRITTRVTVRDREPLLLGGVFLRRWSKLDKGIPVIERVTLLDVLTGSHDTTAVDTELIFLIRPRIRVLRVPPRGIAEEPFPDLLRDPDFRVPDPAPIRSWSSADLGEAPAGR